MHFPSGTNAVFTKISADVIGMSSEAKESKSGEQPGEVEIESRFGRVTVSIEQAIYFPQGMLGLPQNLHFALTDIPRENMGNFKLLQCLNDPALSFVVLPLGIDNKYLERQDLEECCRHVNIDPKDLLVLLVVSVQRLPGSVKVTANMRAPVVVDVKDKAAMQYVFSSNKYEICHVLS